MTGNMTLGLFAVLVWIAEDAAKVIRQFKKKLKNKKKKSRLQIRTENSTSRRIENFLRQLAKTPTGMYSLSDTTTPIRGAEIKTGWKKNWSDFLIKCLTVSMSDITSYSSYYTVRYLGSLPFVVRSESSGEYSVHSCNPTMQFCTNRILTILVIQYAGQCENLDIVFDYQL